jgi:VIT1/CCC1 family predicted Fe2+/Mn2+ transporter
MMGVFVYGAFLSKGKNVSRRDEAVAAIFTGLLTVFLVFFLTYIATLQFIYRVRF